ncbi:MAG TPA: hypothetical protein VJX92_18485 [Methylomirabilota bacterium]|nr:hypothetical protein [Methylomirabilota bacterium]
MRIRDAFPDFGVELQQLLMASSRADLADQLGTLELTTRCSCGENSCSTFYVAGGQSPLTEAQQKDRGPYWKESVVLDAQKGMIVVDLDRVDRIVGFEVLNRPDVEVQLASALDGRRAH